MKIIKIGALWCSGCLVMKPIWKKIEKDIPDLKTIYYDYDENQNEIKTLNIDIKKMPTFIFLDEEGQELERITGEVPEKKLIELINKYKNN